MPSIQSRLLMKVDTRFCKLILKRLNWFWLTCITWCLRFHASSFDHSTTKSLLKEHSNSTILWPGLKWVTFAVVSQSKRILPRRGPVKSVKKGCSRYFMTKRLWYGRDKGLSMPLKACYFSCIPGKQDFDRVISNGILSFWVSPAKI